MSARWRCWPVGRPFLSQRFGLMSTNAQTTTGKACIVRSGFVDDPQGLASITDSQGVNGTIGYHGNGDPAKHGVIVQIHGLKPTFYTSVTP